MSEQPAVEPASKKSNLKTILDVTITTALITSSDYIKVDTDHEIYVKLLRIFAPLLGFLISSFVSHKARNYEDDKDEKRIQGYIDNLNVRIRDESPNRDQKRILTQELLSHQEDLSTLRKQRIKRRMF